MSYAFPPIYQSYIDLWSPFSRIEPVSEVYREKVQQAQTVTLYNKRGQLVEYHCGYGNRSKRV